MTKTAGLTHKREKFAQAVASGMSQSDAYRAAFSTANMSNAAIWVESGRLMDVPAVALRVAELRAPAVEKVGITLESHLRDLLALRNLAAKEKQLSAAIAAEVARGKHAGIVADERTRVVGPDGGPLQTITRIELVARRA